MFLMAIFKNTSRRFFSHQKQEKTKRKQNKKQSCITMRVQLLRKSHFRKSYINPVVINQSRHVKILKEILKLGDVTNSMNLFHFVPLLILT